MPKLLARDAGTAGAASGGSGVSLGVIIVVVIVGTIFVAVGGGLLCTWAARRKRHKRRQSRRAEEEEARKKQMMTVTMMRDSDEAGRPTAGDATANMNVAGDGSAAAAAAAASYFRPGGAPLSDCASSTCCSLASTRGSFSTMDGDFEGSGVTWWWLWRWRRFWHNQRRWVRRQKQRGTAVLGRTGSNSSSSSNGEIKLQSQRNHCQHDHGHHGHHHHRRGTVDGSPRKLRRRRPETSIIASTNSLFFSAFMGENDNNRDAIASNAANGEIGLREPPPTFSIIRANSFPRRPPPPSEQQRLIPNGMVNGNDNGPNTNMSPPKMSGANGPINNGPWAANNINGNRLSMPNMPSRPQNPRYRPQSGPQQAPSLQPPPPISTRSLPRPPQPALIIPSQPETYIPPGVPFYPNMPPHQQRQLMIMMMQQQQMQLQQQIRQQHLQQQQQQQQQQQEQQQQQQQRLSRSGSKHGPQQNYATEVALTEILRSTEQRLAQLQGQQTSGNNMGSMKRGSMTGPARTNTVGPTTTTADADDESIKRISQTSGSDADSMANNSKDVRDSSPILDAIPTALSSPSKSPNKNRVAAGTLAHNGNNMMMAHPMMLPAAPPPAVLLPAPASSTISNSSPETRSPSSVYSSSAASTRSSLSTVYSVDERSEKGMVASRATSKGGVRIANSDDDAQNDRILAGLGITGAMTSAESQFVDAKKSFEDIQVSHAVVTDSTLVPAALSTHKSRASRGMSVSTTGAAVPDLPPRSPKRSAGTVTKGNGIMIPHSASSNSLSSSNSGNTMNVNRGSGPNHNRSNRHRRNGSAWQQAPPPQQFQQYGMGLGINTNNMMHSNSARFTFGGNSSNNTNAGVRLMVTSPSKPDTAATDVTDADLSDEKTPTSITSSSSPNAWRKSTDRSLLCSSPTLAPEDEHSLVPGPRTSWGNPNGHGAPPNPPRHGRRSLNERIEALQAVDNSEDAQFRRGAVRPLPRPPSFGSLNNLNALNALTASMAQNPHASYTSQSSSTSTSQPSGTVVAAAAELRRMNSTAYSEASSCYSNATSAVGKSPALGSIQIATAPSAMGLTQPRRAHRRRNSSAGESASGVASSNRNSVVGSRQYLALGKKRVSQAPSHVGGGAYDKENRDAAAKRSSAPPTASSSGAGRPSPQRTRSARSMTTTGTALRRVDENPASGASTPSGTPGKGTSSKTGTPNKGALTPSATAGSNLSVVSNNNNSNNNSPSTPKANTGRPLRKSPSRSTQVGNSLPSNATGSPVGKLRAKSMMGPSTPPMVRQLRQQHAAAASNRDSLGLYDQDGFLLSSPARKN